MENIKTSQSPEAVLKLRDLDVRSIEILSQHWTVVIEGKPDGIELSLYTKL